MNISMLKGNVQESIKKSRYDFLTKHTILPTSSVNAVKTYLSKFGNYYCLKLQEFRFPIADL